MSMSHIISGIEKGRTLARPTFSKLVQGSLLPGFCSFDSKHHAFLFRACLNPARYAAYPQEINARFPLDHLKPARHRKASTLERTPSYVYANTPNPVAPHIGGQGL